MYKMFDVDSVRELFGMPNASAAQIPASRPEPERNPLIGDPSEYVLAKPSSKRTQRAVEEPVGIASCFRQQLVSDHGMVCAP